MSSGNRLERLQDDQLKIIELWGEWKKTKSSEIRNLIFYYYSPWCRKIASKFFLDYHAPMFEWGDYLHTCSLALFDAIDRYDLAYGVPFEGFAYKRLKGRVASDIKVFYQDHSHNAHSNCRDVVLDRAPDVEDDADSFDAIVDAAVELAFGKFLELGVFVQEVDNDTLVSGYERDLEQKLILRLLEKLDKQELCVLKCHYFHYLSFAEIAQNMNISRQRVSQIHRQGLRELRRLFEWEVP